MKHQPGPLTFRGVPLVYDEEMPQGYSGPRVQISTDGRYARAVIPTDTAVRFSANFFDPALSCAGKACPTPSVCAQAGQCADTIPTITPKD